MLVYQGVVGKIGVEPPNIGIEPAELRIWTNKNKDTGFSHNMRPQFMISYRSNMIQH